MGNKLNLSINIKNSIHQIIPSFFNFFNSSLCSIKPVDVLIAFFNSRESSRTSIKLINFLYSDNLSMTAFGLPFLLLYHKKSSGVINGI